MVAKEKLGKVTIDPVYNTSTRVTGKGIVGAIVKVITTQGEEKEAEVDGERKL